MVESRSILIWSKIVSQVTKLPNNFNGEIDYIEVDGDREAFVHDKANNTIIIKNIDLTEEAMELPMELFKSL